jgi:Flp pilus assembly protein TadD
MADVFSYTIGFDEVDPSLFGAGVDARSKEFPSAITMVLEDRYRDFGGRVEIAVDEGNRRIHVKWSSDPARPSSADVVLERLRHGDYETAVPLLVLLVHHEPHNPLHRYNLGMALSDTGRLDEAQKQLREAVRFDPRNVNARVALGVAKTRDGDHEGAISILREAADLGPDNPWAHRNLGACLFRCGKGAEAEVHLRKSVELAPQDQQSLLGLGQCLEALERPGEADELYIRVIQLGASTPAGEAAKQARTHLAHATFREKSGEVERMDAAMYCLAGLERFEKMSPQQIQQIGFEIALLGMRGLDTADSSQKYSLKALPGRFSGLQLVCLMYVAFKAFAPDKDIGFDLSREYEMAKRMHSPSSRTPD